MRVPPLTPHLRPYRIEIQKRFARAQTKQEIMEWLASMNVSCEFLDLHHFDGMQQQAMIGRWRRKLAQSLPIKDENWCMVKLNRIAADPESSPNEVLGAIRASRQITKGDAVANPREWQGSSEDV